MICNQKPVQTLIFHHLDLQYVVPLMPRFVASNSLLLHTAGVTSAFWVFPDVRSEALSALSMSCFWIRKSKQTGLEEASL